MDKDKSYINKNKYFAKIILKGVEDIEIKRGVWADADILQNILGDAVITYINDPKLNSTNSEINIYIEHIDHKYFHTAKINIFKLNHDIYFSELDSLYYLKPTDYIMCKSNDAVKLITLYKNKKKLRYGVKKLGFTSKIKCNLDNNLLTKKKHKKVIHIAGKSWMKNTLLILETYLEYPDLGELTVICTDMCLRQGKHNYKSNGKFSYSEKYRWGQILNLIDRNNIGDRIRIFPNADEVKKSDGILSNQDSMDYVLSNYGLHLCPSEIEGWGHYLHEAKYCKNIVITTDKSPMNEHIKHGYNGFIVETFNGHQDDYGVYGRFGVKKAKFQIQDMANLIRNIKNMSDEQLSQIANNAHKSFIDNDIKFKKNFIDFINVALKNYYIMQTNQNILFFLLIILIIILLIIFLMFFIFFIKL